MPSSYIGFTRPTITELNNRIISDINTALPGQDASLRNNALNVLATSFAGAAFEIYGYMDDISNQTNILYARGPNLDLFGQIWSITRLPASITTGTATFTGTAGYVLPAGTLVQTTSGIQYSVVADVTLTTGTGTVALTALASGNLNLFPGNTLTLASPVAGIISTLTVIQLSGGAGIETDDSYRARLLNRIKNPAFGGSSNDYVTWALSQPNVTRAWCYPLEHGPGTVVVRYLMDNTNVNGIPLSGDLSAMQTYLNSVRPVCSSVTAVAPTTSALNITITNLTPSTTVIQAAVLAEINDMLRIRAYPGCTIYLSWLWEAVSLATGSKHHLITAPTTDSAFGTGVLPILGTITYV